MSTPEAPNPGDEQRDRGSVAAAYVRRNAAATESPRDDQRDGSDRDESSDGSDGETKQERLTRNWNELLQELRVAQTGVQILTGFLLTIPFTDRFNDLNDRQISIYLTVLVGSVLTTCMIVAPASFHRVLFRQRERNWLVSAANVAARAGLTLLAIVSSGVVLLVFDIVVGPTEAIIAAALVLTVFVVLWLATPLIARD